MSAAEAVDIGPVEVVTVAGVTVAHNEVVWRVCTNRHRTTGGREWGWIEGAPGNVCWSNDYKEGFNMVAAGEMVAAHNRWLEDQQPLSIKIIKARRAFDDAAFAFDKVKKEYDDKANKLRCANKALHELLMKLPT